MTRARPALGYPSRAAACRALALEGLGVREIAARFEAAGETITPTQASALLNYKLRRVAGRLNVCRTAIGPLHHQACQRGITVTELAERLLQIIGQQGLVDAVLDDRPSLEKDLPQ
jgi:hypothetical protein